jgi:hypothetical protein
MPLSYSNNLTSGASRVSICLRFYTLFVYNWPCQQTDACLAHTYFLWALLEQHTKNVQAAREVYKEAVGRCVAHALTPAPSMSLSRNA